MLKDILPYSLYSLLPGEALEVRLRRGMRLSYLTLKGKFTTSHVVSEEEFESVLLTVTERSLYALTEKLVNGYLPLKGGIRVGVAGEGVMEGERVKTVKHVTSLAIRIPHQIIGVSDFLLIDGNFGQNILIVSPPAAGKTTLLRDLTRRISDAGNDVVVLDERGEISGMNSGTISLDVGSHTDVLFGFPKKVAYVNALRALNPDYIVTDELSGEGDIAGIMRAFYGGVRVIATMHGRDEGAIIGEFSPLEKVFDRILVLSKEPRVGTLVKDIAR
ncbi:MAG: stage III sporulation protein AA [Clostridia bacterium]|nr:stage III sporulation protein AA [Clostridia bacterium]